MENYRPHIAIDPEWPMVTFAEAPFEIIDGDRGVNYPKKEDFSPDGYCVFLNTKNVRSDGFNFNEVEFITREKDEALRKGRLRRGDVVLTTRGTIWEHRLLRQLHFISRYENQFRDAHFQA